MLDRRMLYDIIYALAASKGRQEALFGSCAPLAHEAFGRSIAGNGFPELWIELPLLDEPWFDLHVNTGIEQVDPNMEFAPETTGGHPEIFEWFAKQGSAVRQISLGYDVSKGDIDHPAVQLLMRNSNPEVVCSFLETAGNPGAARAYRAFADRLPQDWFPCYMGVFPGREDVNLRVECIPSDERQLAYARDATLLEDDLRSTGLSNLGDDLVPRCQELAQSPFHLEFQFNVGPDGLAEEVLGASLRFGAPSEEAATPFEVEGDAGKIMERVESWGLADDRWRLFGDASFAKRISFRDESIVLYAYPAFVKLRWREGKAVDAKTYFVAGAV